MLQMEGISATPNDTAPAAAVAVAAAAGGNTDEDLLLARCARRRRLRLRRLLNQEGGLDAPPPLPVPRNSIVLPEEAHTRKNHLAVARMPVINNNNNNNNGVVSSSTTPSPARSPSPILCSGGASHYGSVCIIGKRRDMEDAVTIAPDFVTGHDFFGVYDGHGGREVAEACKERMHVVLAGEVQKNSSFTLPDVDKDVVLAAAYWREAMEACFLKVDSEVIAGRSLVPGSAPQKTVGSTAVVAVLGPRRIVVGNCGDSRAVLCRSGVTVPLSHDHKPDRPDELERVEALGGRVIDWDGYRVLGVLATSRSIGDQYLKPFVIPEPEVTVTDRTDRDEFLILASDGLWDVVSSERACALVRMCLDGRVAGGLSRRGETTAAASGDGDQPAAFAATALAELAMSRGSRDNISVVVVVL